MTYGFNIALTEVQSSESLEFTTGLEVPITARPAADLDQRLTHPIVAAGAARRCPECDSIVYSRRHQLCGVCAQPLPVDYLFSPNEARRVEVLLTTERARHRQWVAKVTS